MNKETQIQTVMSDQYNTQSVIDDEDMMEKMDECCEKAHKKIADDFGLSVKDVPLQVAVDIMISDDSQYGDIFFSYQDGFEYNHFDIDDDNVIVNPNSMELMANRLEQEHPDLYFEIKSRFEQVSLAFERAKVSIALKQEKRYFMIEYQDLVDYMYNILIKEDQEVK